MKSRIFSFCIVVAITLASAESVREFQSSDGLVRITLIPKAAASDSTASVDSLSAAPMDSSGSLSALFPSGVDEDALLEIYFLEKSTGEELRFPIKCSQMRGFLEQSQAGTGLDNDRMVALVREMSVSLNVHMKTSDAGDGK